MTTGKSNSNDSRFLIKSQEDQKLLSQHFKMLKGKTRQPKILYPVKKIPHE